MKIFVPLLLVLLVALNVSGTPIKESDDADYSIIGRILARKAVRIAALIAMLRERAANSDGTEREEMDLRISNLRRILDIVRERIRNPGGSIDDLDLDRLIGPDDDDYSILGTSAKESDDAEYSIIGRILARKAARIVALIALLREGAANGDGSDNEEVDSRIANLRALLDRVRDRIRNPVGSIDDPDLDRLIGDELITVNYN